MPIIEDAERIMKAALAACLPDTAVKNALRHFSCGAGKIYLVAVGKAAWQMASAASEALSGKYEAGIIITKYGHAKGPVARCRIVEAGHPVPDENSYRGTEEAIRLVSGLTEEDRVIFLVSGGGSALFELPLIPAKELEELTQQMLACGADIGEINTIRKRMSAVKGGRFAGICEPAKIFSVVLSDVLGDSLDTIASGPAYPDGTTCEEALKIAEKYGLKLSEAAKSQLMRETPKVLNNVETHITGSVRELCRAAEAECEALGYETVFLTDRLTCEAKDAGSFLASILKSHENSSHSLAFIAGGETVVHLTGSGKGGRNQELALSAAAGIDGISGAVVFSIGSDGTDGPTDAAGGIVDGNTAEALRRQGISIDRVLSENDSYHALEKVNALIVTGPTGTNVNDLSVGLLKR